jgi:hypothetical protein
MEPLMSLTLSQLLVPVLIAVVIGLIIGFSLSRNGINTAPVVVQTNPQQSGELMSLLAVAVIAGGIVIVLLMRILS